MAVRVRSPDGVTDVKIVWPLVALSLIVPVVAQAADRRVTVVNATAHTMTRLYASPAEGQPVDEDMLGDTVLKPGQSAQLSVGDGSDACVYNFKATFDDDKTRVRRVDVCEVRTYRFTGE
jgi:hypothetical protein